MRSLSYRQVTAPTEYPISLGDVKRYAVIDHNDDDPLLLDLINDATDYAQHYMNTQLCSAQYAVYYPSFDDCLLLPLKPVVSVDTIAYYDTDDVEQTLDSAVYQVNQYGQNPAVTLTDGQSWPTVGVRVNPITVTFTAGYGSSREVPGAIKRAIAMLVRHFDENREGIAFARSSEMPHSVTAMLNRYRNYQPV